MNRLDEAVLELLSSAPRTTSVDALRARSKRVRRRRAATMVAIAVAIAIGSVGVAASLGHDRNGPHVEVSPTTSTPVDRTWCVAFLRDQAVARGLAYGSVIVDAPSTRAKLVSLAELLDGANNPLTTTEPQTRLTEHKKFWVIELRATGTSQGPYSWSLVAIDANTGAVVTGNEGPSSGGGGAPTEPATEPQYFDSLPDHGAACPDGRRRLPRLPPWH